MQPLSFLRNTVLMASLMATAACGVPPSDSAYFNRGGPESLIDVSSEVVNLSANSEQDLKELAAWVEKDSPTRAELNCDVNEKRCDITRKVLDLHGVPVVMGMSNDNSVTLVYERILARDCDQRYVDNPRNYYNTNHRAFGCATAANMVQQVTNKQEFISPNLSDDPSAVRAINDMNRAYVPRPIVDSYNVGDSAVAKSKSN